MICNEERQQQERISAFTGVTTAAFIGSLSTEPKAYAHWNFEFLVMSRCSTNPKHQPR